MERSFLIAGRRSAVAPQNGAFKLLEPHEIAQPVIEKALSDAAIDREQVGEIIVSNALGAGGNPARRIALAAKLPESVAGLSIDRQCAGGLDALIIADAMIRSGQHDIVIAGGVESYSRRPIRFHQFNDGREPLAYEQAPFTPWPDRDPDMAEAADALSVKLEITRKEQDSWAIKSHAKAFRTEIPPEIVEVAKVYEDSFKRNLSQKLCERATVVRGNITSANMAVAADAAAFVVMVSEKYFETRQQSGVAFLGGKTLGGAPLLPGLAPVNAVKTLMVEHALTPSRLTNAEIMEAFAVQAIACQRQAEIPEAVVNQKGGALARGHPIGASGTILATRIFHDLVENKGTGLAMIAAAGGLGTAALFQSH